MFVRLSESITTHRISFNAENPVDRFFTEEVNLRESSASAFSIVLPKKEL